MNELSAEGVPGIVLEVSQIPSGSALNGDHAIGATVLMVDDIADFSESGGQLSIGGTTTILSYTSIDPAFNTILLSAPTTVLYEDTTEILVYPASMVKMALVQTDEGDDGFKVRIPHSLADRFVTGIREPEEQENVVVRLDGATWMMTDASGIDSTVTGSLIRTAEDGQRWEIGSSTQWYGDYRSIKAFSGRTDETAPAEIFSRGTGIGIKSTAFTNTPPAEFGVANREFESGPLLYMGIISMYAGSMDLIASDGPAEDGSKFGSQVRIEANPDSSSYQGSSNIIARSNGLDDKAGLDLFSNGKIKVNAYTIGGSGNDASIDIFMGGDPEFAGTPTARIFMDDDQIFLKVGSKTLEVTASGVTIDGDNVSTADPVLDTGWIDVTVNSGFVAQSTPERPQVRLRDGLVYFQGGWGAGAGKGITAVNTTYTVGSIPADDGAGHNLRPIGTTRFGYGGSSAGAATASVLITTGGDVQIRTGATLGAYYFPVTQPWFNA